MPSRFPVRGTSFSWLGAKKRIRKEPHNVEEERSIHKLAVGDLVFAIKS